MIHAHVGAGVCIKFYFKLKKKKLKYCETVRGNLWFVEKNSKQKL